MISSSRSASRVASTAVGSSKTSTRAFWESALAISTTCWWATERLPTSAAGEMSNPSCESSSPARLRSCRQAMVAGSSPRKMFSATERSGASASSWWMTAMPRARASSGPWRWTGWPSSSMCPDVGCSSPPRMRISVDLPAPFSPTSACTSPAPSEKLAPSSARIPLNALVMPCNFTSSVKADLVHLDGAPRSRDKLDPGQGITARRRRADAETADRRAHRKRIPLDLRRRGEGLPPPDAPQGAGRRAGDGRNARPIPRNRRNRALPCLQNTASAL